jgi:hypothetical protein
MELDRRSRSAERPQRNEEHPIKGNYDSVSSFLYVSLLGTVVMASKCTGNGFLEMKGAVIE